MSKWVKVSAMKIPIANAAVAMGRMREGVFPGEGAGRVI
jgi:hypothetical protein